MKVFNWAGTFSFTPTSILSPAREEEIVLLVKKANQEKRKIRLVGTAHSWTKLIATDDILLSLDNYQGITEYDQKEQTATVLAGTKLKRLGIELKSLGLAQENLGDIDVQSIAGATSTGTHGTGLQFKSLSNQILEIELLKANGEIITISSKENAEIFDLARLALGTLGIILKVKLKLQKSFKLHVKSYPLKVETMLENYQELLKTNRHFEIFYFPHAPRCLIKTMNESTQEIKDSKISSFINDKLLENDLFGLFNVMASKTKQYKFFRKIMNAFLGTSEKINFSHQVFATKRSVKFFEMEYAIPIDSFKECFEEIQKVLKKENFQTLFPIEIRFVKKDPLWFSGAYARDVVYFAVHMHRSENCDAYFKAVEKIFWHFGGKPHWGKIHHLNDEYLEKNYIHLEQFLKIRQEFDPHKVFINSYLEKLFKL